MDDSFTAAAGGRPLAEIKSWIFDLDNTLYPLTATVYTQVEERMAAFIMAEFAIDRDAAHDMRRRFFAAHGTTLRGLMLDHGVDPARFLDYVHEIDLSSIAAHPELVAAINALPGRKLIFTNATARHAERVMERIGLTGHIEAVHDIIACGYVPKPNRESYAKLLFDYAVDPRTALMVEDIARNLEPAAALGMTTAWVRNPLEWAKAGSDQPYVHHVVDDLAAWLAGAATIDGQRNVPQGVVPP